MKKRLFIAALASMGSLVASQPQSAPIASASSIGAGGQMDTLVHKAWHSGVPHRRIVGKRVYGGNCPPQGCSASSQRDLAQDQRTGEWFSPYNERQRAMNPNYGREPPRRSRQRY
jgi:hypothetical protein